MPARSSNTRLTSADSDAFKNSTARSSKMACPVHCLMAGLFATIVLILLYLNLASCRAVGQRVPMYVSSMRSKLMSAKNAHLESSRKSEEDVHAKSLKDLGKVQNLTHCAGGECGDITKVSAELKQKYDQNVMEKIDASSECMLMVYAPWCPHCSTAIPQFASASAHPDVQVPFFLINAELVSPSLLMGDGATVANVQHFPYICKRTKKDGAEAEVHPFNGDISSENLVAFSKKASLDYMFT